MARTKRNAASTSKSAKESRARTRTAASLKKKGKPKSRAKQQSRKAESASPEIKTLFFWDASDRVTGFLSPWYKAPFEDGEVTYQSVGHYIMAAKARLFNDKKALEKILASVSSDEHRALGNSVKGFKDSIWQEKVLCVASRANEQKFLHGRNAAALRKKLLPFADHELVYASPTDYLFGIGLSAEDAGDPKNIKNRKRWGRNLFGQSLSWCKKQTWNLANPAAAAAANAKFDVSVFDRPGMAIYW
ncbi:DUF1768-domain-containing protein [Bimuria novae-zelandiae CBS 107.79]|uniref:DUF1768-domain-containing protein n=1 Tax=Bimuria novae-zelandiae CBS 107.79 TaxID=1447943 RepID=A0A6A5VEL9_9PLEO|nr:DUF1768-domain-containing protein [Bimuria novae-zelandiae CBS 107.79]